MEHFPTAYRIAVRAAHASITVIIHKAEKQWQELPQDQLVCSVEENNISTTITSRLTAADFALCISKGTFLLAYSLWSGIIKAHYKNAVEAFPSSHSYLATYTTSLLINSLL